MAYSARGKEHTIVLTRIDEGHFVVVPFLALLPAAPMYSLPPFVVTNTPLVTIAYASITRAVLLTVSALVVDDHFASAEFAVLVLIKPDHRTIVGTSTEGNITCFDW